MGIIARKCAELRSTVAEISLRNPPEWLINLVSGGQTAAGIPVDSSSAMGLSTVYACVKLIAWAIASLPLHVLRDLIPAGKEKDKKNRIYSLLHDSPNGEMTSFQWRSFMSVMQNLWGAGISEIEFDSNGFPVALWPIPTWRARPIRLAENNKLMYEITPANGPMRRLRPENVLVFPALSSSVDQWISPITQHRETIGSALAVRKFGANVFSKGTNPGAILSGVKPKREMTEQQMREKYREQYEGLSNASRLMLLEEGVKFERIGLPPQDAQYLDTRRFDTAEIARIFSVPLNLIQDTTGSTSWGSGLEELNTAFVIFTLRPYLVQYEQELKRRLLGEYTDRTVEFVIDGLLRGKLLERYQAYAVGRQWGWLNPNDVCELENRNPLPGDQGNIYLVPMNMVDAREAGKKPKPIKKPKEKQIEDPSASQIKK
jgi:HK97 family phage portal protein